MTGVDWGSVITAALALAGALTGYLKSRSAQNNANAAHARLDKLENPPQNPPPASGA